MFEFLSGLGEEIQARYKTVICDIKSKSNSFYDAYLDLQEASIKAILERYGIDYDESRTCGYLLRGDGVMDLFLNKLRVPKDAYEQIHDRTLKVNRHKHHKEKHIVPDSVVVFMETFHRFMKACCESDEEFDADYYRDIFGEYERVNLALKKEKDSIISEIQDLVKEKRMTEDQLRSYQEALSMSQASKEGLAEQNDALLQEISALKSLKLSILDQKLNRTIDMLNELQDYVAESRAVSLAVGYTVVGKERIGTYIDIARKELGRPDAAAPSPAISEPQPVEDSNQKTEEESQPANILDTMTKIPEEPTLSEHIGESPDPYIRSKEITVFPNDKDISKKKKGYALRAISIGLSVAIITMCLFLEGWLKLIAILPFFTLVIESLEAIWYVKNLRRISIKSVWINKKTKIEINEVMRKLNVGFSSECGVMTSFLHSSLLYVFFSFTWIGLMFAGLLAFIFHFSTNPPEWATVEMLITIPIGAALSLTMRIIYDKKPIPWSGRYVCFKGPNGYLVYDSTKVLLEAWRLEKKDI